MRARATLVVVMLAAGVSAVEGQSLADVARAEAERRKATPAPSKVYTNEDLRPEPNPPAPPAPANPAGTAPASPAVAEPVKPDPEPKAAAEAGVAPDTAASGAPRNQQYWANRITEARSKVERSRSFAQALQNRVDMLWTDFVNRGDPVQQRAIEQDRNKAIAELEQLKLEIVENERAVTAIEEDARRQGVPPGWLRPE